MATVYEEFQLYDTTLRDGVQQSGMVLSVADKLAVARQLDAFGVTFIEGGWPGAIPKDTEFFQRAGTELSLRNAQLVAFGATRRPGVAVRDDPQVAALLAAQTPVVTLVAKSDSRHVALALRTTADENLAMIRDTVRHLVAHGRRVFLDAEHFFDGYRSDPGYALEVVRHALAAGAEVVVLCDTNGGTLPQEIGEVVSAVAGTGATLGIHCHDDGGCAVANTLSAVQAGAVQVQVTAHGYGERCGNANLFSVVGNLAMKKAHPVVTAEALLGMVDVARAISEITGIPQPAQAPYVGSSAFAHKAGLHASAVRVDPSLYQHVVPELIGNTMRTVISDQAGRSSIEMKARELGYDIPAGSAVAGRIAGRVKTLEQAGYSFEVADASFELVLRTELATQAPPSAFRLDTWRLVTGPDPDGAVRHEAMVTARLNDEPVTGHGTGDGPIAALNSAVQHGLAPLWPQNRWQLIRSRVRPLRGAGGDGVRVLLTFADRSGTWSTVGVGQDVAAACWVALRDAADYAEVLARRGQVDAGDRKPGAAAQTWTGDAMLRATLVPNGVGA